MGPAESHAAGVAVDVVVVAYNSGATLRACVEPLAHARDIEVCIVDNASPESGLEVVHDLPVRLERERENRGFAAGCNVGWRTGRSPYVLFLNPDAEIDESAVRTLVGVLESRPEAGVAAPRILGEEGELHHSLRRFPSVRNTFGQALFLHRLMPDRRWTDELVREPEAYASARAVDWASGACLLVRRSLLELLDGLDERFFMYCEDTDLCRRAWDAGLEVRFVPEAVVRHLGGRSAPRASLLPVLARSRRLYAEKHSGRAVAATIRVGIALGELTHLLARPDGKDVRQGRMRALAAMLGPVKQ
jgi:N-acetylglucosaminyl-diphospho-decaprenol L-rhamnosyltransferase